MHDKVSVPTWGDIPPPQRGEPAILHPLQMLHAMGILVSTQSDHYPRMTLLLVRLGGPWKTEA